jgi:hypothetical protein
LTFNFNDDMPLPVGALEPGSQSKEAK